MSTQTFWLNSRPAITVEHTGGRNLGRCYNMVTYRVTSTRPLAKPFFDALRASGAVDDGQGFGVSLVGPDGSKSDVQAEVKWNTRPPATGSDLVQAAEVDTVTGKPTGRPGRTWSGEPCKPLEMPYWAYDIEVYIDSSD